MDRGVVYCMTSNYHPDELYKDGLKREEFLPTIELIKERLDVIQVDGGTDYRRRALQQVKVYHTPLAAGDRRGAAGGVPADRRGRGGIATSSTSRGA